MNLYTVQLVEIEGANPLLFECAAHSFDQAYDHAAFAYPDSNIQEIVYESDLLVYKSGDPMFGVGVTI